MYTSLSKKVSRARRFLAAAACVALLSACAPSYGEPLTKDASGNTKVTIAYGAPTADQMIPSVAASAGLFQKYGINPDIKYLESSQLLSAVVAGQVNMAVIPAPGYELIALNGRQLKAIARMQDSFDVMWVSNPDYATPRSMDGRSIAISKPGAFSGLMAEMAEHQFGVSMTQVPLGGLSNQVSAFQSGQVDSISDLSPDQLPGVEKHLPGVHTLVDWRTVKDVPAMMLVGYGPWLEQHRAAVENVLRAINDGATYFRTHEAESVSVISKVTGRSAASSKVAYENAVGCMSASLLPSLAAEQKSLQYLGADYPQAKTFDASQLIDDSYMKAALGQ
ncbi:ABC transporter substrate-binding protein [Amycolatopsis acidicola]|uniref:ABC transporter substrate-binding protein n=1 Tax=Amycolatopsis acidicola TaxID=2596893 RepID=A0A5N0UZ44_9PSEU|nr:ABC transporter substrate-binding protein [Amycolatopsis acidicola]KAA9159056.1 ABC transporter substrate-binding protein [Amycolatopsis acidicola]